MPLQESIGLKVVGSLVCLFAIQKTSGKVAVDLSRIMEISFFTL